MENKSITERKLDYLRDEAWMLTLSTAFQHANVYQLDVSDDAKRIFKDVLKDEVLLLTSTYHLHTANDHLHLENIEQLGRFSERFHEILKGGRLHFGVCQKLLNQFLKYVWCAGIMTTPPPHFPIDKNILKLFGFDDLQANSLLKAFDGSKYMKVIELARTKLPEYGVGSLPELELVICGKPTN